MATPTTPEKTETVPFFNWSALMVAVEILRSHQIEVYVGGEAALAYYNSLNEFDRTHDYPVFELVVSAKNVKVAPGILAATGLFEITPQTGHQHNYHWKWRHHRQSICLETSHWPGDFLRFVVVECDDEDQDYLERLRPWSSGTKPNFGRGPSPEDLGFTPGPESSWLNSFERDMLPWPPLPALIARLMRKKHLVFWHFKDLKYTDSEAQEQAKELMDQIIRDLVRGMQLTPKWARDYLESEYPDIYQHVHGIIEAAQNVLDSEKHKIMREYPGRGME